MLVLKEICNEKAGKYEKNSYNPNLVWKITWMV